MMTGKLRRFQSSWLRVVWMMFLMVAGVVPCHAAGASIMVYGLERFDRTTGAPNSYTVSFNLPAGASSPYELTVQNGDTNGSNRVSSATLTLNGTQIAGPSRFSQNVSGFVIPVALSYQNSMTVQLASKPGSYLLISVKGTSPLPVIQSISPNNVAVGHTVTVSGVNFGSTVGQLTLGGVLVSTSSWTSNSINFQVPSTARTGANNVVVTTSAGSSAPVTLNVQFVPHIDSISPTIGLPYAQVTVNGTGFGNNTAGRVSFNGSSGQIVSWGDTQIVVKAPDGSAGGGAVLVSWQGVSSNAVSFNYTPTISYLANSTVERYYGSFAVVGQNFLPTAGTVTLNGVPLKVYSWSNNSISLPVPQDNCTGSIVVNTEYGASNAATLTINGSKPGCMSTTPLSIQASVAPAPNAAGWNNSDVTVSYTCSGGLAPVQCPAPRTVSGEGAGQMITAQATDASGKSASASVTANIDKTIPEISASVSPQPNASGWNNGNVTVSFQCADAGAGIASCPSPINVTTEGAGQSFSGTAVDKAGNSKTATVAINIAKTAPVIKAVVFPAPNAEGWNNSDVTVSYQCSSAGGLGMTCPPPQTITAEGAGQAVSGTVTDVAGNTATASASISIDKSLPTITAAVTPAPNASGWNDSDVTVSFACSDSVSGVVTCPAAQTITGAGKNQQVVATVSDKAGNVATSTVSVNIDRDQPTIVPSISPSPNAAGWNNTDVTVSFTCTGGLSGVVNCSAPIIVSTEGKDQQVSGSVMNGAGKTVSTSVTVNLDKTAPTISAMPSPVPNSAGWNNSDVDVAFACTDTLSGIASCASPLKVSAEGASQGVSGTATDLAGNTASAGLTLNVDKTPPTISASATPSPNAAGWNNSDVRVSFSCADGLSGVATCPGASTVSAEGANQSVAGEASDLAGNHSQPATVSVSLDKTVPTIVQIAVPDQLVLGQNVLVTAALSDNIGIDHVTFTVNDGNAVTVTAAPYQTSISAPAGASAGDTLTLTIEVVDVAGNVNTAKRGIKLVANGILAGQVLSDATGLPLAGAKIQVIGSTGQADTSDSRGRYSIPVTNTHLFLQVTKDADPATHSLGMMTVEREVSVEPGVGTVPVDARLTPLASPVSIDTSGGTLQASVVAGLPGISVTVPAGALQAATVFQLTSLSGQGLPNLLPLGWSPISAFDLRPSGSTSFTASATFTDLPTQPLHLVAYNSTVHGWFMMVPNLSPSADRTLTVSLPATGVYALVAADQTTPAVVIPGANQPLTGLQLASLPPSTSSTGSLNPPALPASGGTTEATLNVQASATVPSGTVVQSVVSESYALRSGSTISEESRLQDIVLYQKGEAAGALLTAQFPITPSRTFGVAELASGKVHLDILAGRENVRGQVGGSGPVVVQSEDGTASVTVGSGSLQEDTAVSLESLSLASYLPQSSTFAPLAAVYADFSGQTLSATAQLSIPAPSSIASTDSLFVAEIVRVGGVPHLAVVSLAQVSGEKIVSVPYPGLKGVVEDGEYVFYRSFQPLGFISGTATANSQPVGAVIQSDSLPFIAIANAQGKYIVGVAPGSVHLTAAVPNTAMAASATAESSAKQTTVFDLVLTGTVTNATVVPQNGTKAVAVTTQITVTTTQPISTSSISASTIKLYRGEISGNQTVPVHFVPLAGGAGLAVVPDQVLQQGTQYTFAASGLADIFGAYISVPKVSFTTRSDTPQAFDPNRITFAFPDANGSVHVSAPMGSMQPGTRIMIVDLTSGLVVTFMVANDGSLSGDFPATLNDRLQVTATDPNGAATTFVRSQFVAADGTVAVGSGGGTVSGPGGVELRIPDGALDKAASFKIEAFGPDLFPQRPDLPGATFGSGLKITSPDKPIFKKEVKLAFPKPAGAPDGSFFYVYRLLNGPNGKHAFETLDHAFVEGSGSSAKVVTASYPFSGYTTSMNVYSISPAGQFGIDGMLENYAIMMWTYDQVRPGLASIGAITGKVQCVVPPGATDKSGKVKNTGTEPIYVPVKDAIVTGVDPYGQALINTADNSIVARSLDDGTFTLWDRSFSGGTVRLTAISTDGMQPGAVTATAYEVTVLTDKSVDQLAGPLLPKYKNVAFASLNFPAQTPAPPAPQVLIQLLTDANQDAKGVIVAGTPLTVAITSSAQVTGVSIDGVPYSFDVPQYDGSKQIYTTRLAYSTSQAGVHNVVVTTQPAFGQPVTGTKSFLVVVQGENNSQPIVGRAPAIVSATPERGATGVPVDVFPTVTFSEPVTNVPGNISLVADDGSTPTLQFSGFGYLNGDLAGSPVALQKVGPKDAVMSVTIQPASGLKYQTHYKFKFGTGIVDLDNVVDSSKPALALVMDANDAYNFKTFGPQTLGGTQPFSSTRAVVIGNRAYVGKVLSGTMSELTTYDISDPASPVEVASASKSMMLGRVLDIAGQENAPAIGGRNLVALATGVGATEYGLPSNLWLYDVTGDQAQRVGAVSVTGSSVNEGIILRVALKDNSAYTSVFRQGIEVVDLGQAISDYSAASPIDLGQQLSTDGMGFARDAVVNVIPVKDDSGRNAVLQDLKAGDFLLSTGEQSTLVVATGSVPGAEAPTISFVVANPQSSGPSGRMYAGVPQSGNLSLTSGTAVALGQVTDSQADASGNLVQKPKPVAVVVGRGSTADSGSAPVLTVIDLSDPARPTLMGAVKLDATPTDVILKDQTALVGTAENRVLLVNVNDPRNPASAGSISGSIFGERLALTADGVLIGTSFDGTRGGLETAAISQGAVDNFGPRPETGPCTNCLGIGQPINAANGNVWIQQSDYTLPGLGGGIGLSRTWNSLWQSSSPVEVAGAFGNSWRSSYEERLMIPQSGSTSTPLKYWRGDGSVWYFRQQSDGSYAVSSPASEHARLQYAAMTGLYTMVMADGTQRTFNSGGYLTALQGRNGNKNTIAYDSLRRIANVTDAAGRVLTFNYSGTSRQAQSIQDAVGIIASYTYDATGRLTQVKYADNSSVNMTYDAANMLTRVSDDQGKLLEAHTYDGKNRGLTSSRADGVEAVSISYTATGESQVSNSQHLSTTYKYGTFGGRSGATSISGAGCATCSGTNQSFAYDGSGNRTSETDANGHATQYNYDASGNVTRTTTYLDSKPVTYSYTYNRFGEVLTATDPLGNTTTNTYDAKGNLLSTTTPSPDGVQAGSTTKFAYDARGQLTGITDPRGNTTAISYTNTGLVESVTAGGSTTRYEYDARGNRTAVVDAMSNRAEFSYDAMGRLLKVSAPDKSTTSYSYDSRGRRISATVASSKTTQYAYDDADRLLAITDAASNVTRYGYDSENNLTSITDALKRVTSFRYDEQGRVTQTIFPSQLSESYTYDAAGNLLTKKDRKGQTISYSYDALGRLSSKSAGVSYTYDLVGRLLKASDSTGTYGFSYDNVGRLTKTDSSYSFLEGKTFTNSYGYDAASNRTSFTDPTGSTNTYVYDNLNRLTDITNSWAGHFGFTYDTLSRRMQMSRANGVATGYKYDSVSQLLSVLHGAGSSLEDGASYGYDVAGNRTSKENHLTGAKEDYGYDAIYQLTQVMQTVSGAQNTSEQYSYDAVGNRLSALGKGPYSINPLNQLLSMPTVSYTYDSNGNMLTKTDASGTTQFAWDVENRLTQVTKADGTAVTFKYDPFGRRIQKSSAGAVTNYIYDGDNAVGEYDGTGRMVASYAQGAGIDEPLAMQRGGMMAFYHGDGLGSITSLTDGNGATLNTYVYDSFGQPRSAHEAVFNPFRYTAREWDQETGLYYYRARYYDPQIGKFISEDPLGFSGSGTNFYAYVENDPIDWNDPWGLRKCKGKARIMQGNRDLIGEGGAFDTGPSNLAKYAVTEDSAAVIPFQFGQTRSSMRKQIDEISGTVSGSYTTYQQAGKKKVEVPVSYQFDFQRVRDQVDDYDTRTKNKLKTTSAYQKWLVKRERGMLIIELPGMSHDGGIGSVLINVPDNWKCPCGTTEVK